MMARKGIFYSQITDNGQHVLILSLLLLFILYHVSTAQDSVTISELEKGFDLSIDSLASDDFDFSPAADSSESSEAPESLESPETSVSSETSISPETSPKIGSTMKSIASTDSQTSLDSSSTPFKIVMSIKGKDIYETLLTAVGQDTSYDTLHSFILTHNEADIYFKYSGFTKTQLLFVKFYEDTFTIDETQARGIKITKMSFKREAKALLLQVLLARVNWLTYLYNDTTSTIKPLSVSINRKVIPSSFNRDPLKLTLNRFDLNVIALKPESRYKQGTVLIEFPTPYAPPQIVESQALKATIVLDSIKRKAYIHTDFLPHEATVTIQTKVQYAHCKIKEIKSGKIYEIRETTGNDAIRLACDKRYEFIFRKPGYISLRKLITLNHADTIITWTWEPLERKQITLRSLALPGFGQIYSERKAWWWPAAIATTSGITIASAIARKLSKDMYEKNNERYLHEPNEYARRKYDQKRRDALKDWRITDRILYISIGTLTALWGANVGDAFFFAIGPETKIKMELITPNPKLTIDF